MAKKDDQTSKELTRRQVALSRREQEKQKVVFMGLGLVGALVAIVLIIGLVQTYIIEPNSAVTIVNDEEITTQQYRDRVQYERFLLEDQYQQIVNELTALPEPTGEEDQFSQMIRNQYQQMANQVLQQRSVVDRQALDEIIIDKLVIDEAAARGITATEDEVTEAIERRLAGRQGGLTSAAAEATTTARAEASATAALWTPTPTFTPAPTLTSTQSLTPTATPANTPTPAPTPTLNVIGQDALTTAYTNWLTTIEEQTGLTEEAYRDLIRRNVLRNKLADALGEEVPREAEQANARHILVETEEEAQTVLERLESGEDFADLAAELSQDPSSAANGGELGFIARGRLVEPVEEAIFTLPPGEVSDPIETQFGWHIIEVLEREERELEPVDYSQRQRQAFSDWVTTARQQAQIEDFWTPDRAPEDPFMEQF